MPRSREPKRKTKNSSTCTEGGGFPQAFALVVLERLKLFNANRPYWQLLLEKGA